jgi:Fe-S oxidoreductase
VSATLPPAPEVPATENCRFCWMCRQVCPVGHVTARETLTPHAWALTIESVKRGQLAWNRETADVMYACADCGLCRSHCVTDQPLPDAIVTARAEIVRLGVAPGIVADIDRKLRTYGNPYADEAPASSRRGSRGPAAPVALFVGDAGQYLGPRSVDAAMGLLRAIGIEVVPIGRGRSSGLLASALGLTATAEMLGQAVLQEIEDSGATDLLVLAAGDRWAFEYAYSRRLGLTWPKDVRVREVTDVLAAAVADGRLRLEPDGKDVPYAYHDPCHSARVPLERPAPRALLAAALGPGRARELFWRGHRAHPCGAISGLEFTSPRIARQLAEARLRDAAGAGAGILVTEDPACLAHLGAHDHQDVVVTGLFALLAERLRT